MLRNRKIFYMVVDKGNFIKDEENYIMQLLLIFNFKQFLKEKRKSLIKVIVRLWCGGEEIGRWGKKLRIES